MKLEDIRAKFPQYAEVSDGDLLIGLHRRFYPDVHPRDYLNTIDGAANAHATIRNPELRDYWQEKTAELRDGENSEQRKTRLVGTNAGPVGSPGGAVESAMRGGFQGLTWGAGDEIVAGATSAIKGTDYDAELQAERDRLRLGQDQYPVATYGGEVAGAMVAPAAAFKAMRTGNPLKRAATTSWVAGIEGATYGFNAGEGGIDDRLENARDVGTLSAGIGAVAPGIGAAGQRVAERVLNHRAAKEMQSAAPSIADLRTQANTIFSRADDATGLSRDPLANAAGVLEDKAVRAGMDEVLTPQSQRAVNRMMDEATSPEPTIGFRDLDILRRQAQIPAGSAVPVERAIGTKLVRGIDDVIDQADPSLGAEVAEARKMWGQMRRAEMLEEAFNKASRQASGEENGIRIQLRHILNNPKKRAMFSPDEVAAMEKVVQGTVTSNVLKKIGKFGVGDRQQSNALLAALGTGAGVAVGDAFGLAVPAIGTLAQKAGRKQTEKYAELARALTASGGVFPRVSLPMDRRLAIENVARRGARTMGALDL